MRPILTPAEAGALDRESEARGVTVAELMENAGRAVATAAEALAGGSYGRRAVVVAGKGNNGGDGLVAARSLAGRGMRVCVVLLEPPEAFGEPASTNLERARAAHPAIRLRAFSTGALARELARADVVIDAIFGTGFRGVAGGEAAEAIAAIGGADAPVVAVDIPSGVNAESGAIDGPAVAADVTVTFGAAKPGAVLLPGAANAGVVEVVDIGFPPDLVSSDTWLLEAGDAREAVPRRALDTHKRADGVVVVIGGSRRMTGAVCLSAEAAYRAGAGLVTVAVPEGILPVVQTRLRETTFLPLPETDEGTIAATMEPLERGLEAADAVAIGPGLTTNEETAAYVRTLVRACPVPLVLDADGLNAFAGHVSELADRRSPAVLTPHAGEFARLSGIGAREVGADRIGNARKLAAETNAVVLLKGSRTVVAAPDGRVLINPTGTPFLATGGTGDVLTGTVAALIARGADPLPAAGAAAYVHGIAGQLAGRDLGDGTTAGDVLERLPAAFVEVLEA
jgi:ADP-dependent NAD(P)H-hydrate dehydratase / NAD(P)H-hydrate epimerase